MKSSACTSIHDCMLIHADCQVIIGESMRSETGDVPYKYTTYMGEMVRKAREEMGMSQEELAQKIYRKRLAVSEMENGKVEISAWTLPYLSIALKKPLSYFFPPNLRSDIPENSLNPIEHELIKYFRDIDNEYLHRVAIDLIKVIANFDPLNMLLDNVDLAIEEKERIESLKKIISKQKKQ